MALKTYKTSSDWNRIRDEIQSSIQNKIDFDSVSAILMIKILGNVQSKNRAIQKNIDDVKDFFPIPYRSIFSDKWRYRFKTLYANEESFTVIRPNSQNTYDYVQITFEGAIQDFKRSLNSNDRLIILKKKNSDTYEVFSINSSIVIFSENDDFVAFDFSKNDETYFSAPEILTETIENTTDFSKIDASKQKIYFGSPGTGKSKAMQNFANNNGLEVIRTTFHPDTDYHSFVGGYKPVMDGKHVTYQFIPQAFTKAYMKAKQNQDKYYLLAIEEINRGNCAQIFGDLFQCLDRNSEGYSYYPIDANTDLANYLALQGLANSEQLILPPNLLIYATMNTSDQSLFPMDSAFKRRWDWEYVGIDWDDANSLTIKIDEKHLYNWGDFIRIVNKNILIVCKSEDKQIGNRFVSPSNGNTISLDQFQSKVMFYLWLEIFKDEHQSAESIFKYKILDAPEIDFTFNELFENNGLEKIKGFMNYLKIPLINAHP